MTQTHPTIAYCATCDADREFQPRDVVQNATIRGKPISATVPSLVCPHCGAVRSLPEHDPMEALNAVYRTERGLLQPRQIRSLRDRYGLAQDTFATVLGMSPTTIVRYEGGALQDESQDNLLRACDDPRFMLARVSQHRHQLSAMQIQRFNTAIQALPVAFTPAEADDVLTDYVEFHGNRAMDQQRLEDLVYELCRQIGGAFKTKLNKLAFYADFIAYNHLGQSISGSAYRAIQHGPVPANYDMVIGGLEASGRVVCSEVDFGTVTGIFIKAEPQPEAVVFGIEEQRVIAFVADYFRSMTSTEIRNFSHQEKAYAQTPPKRLITYRFAAELNLRLPCEF